MRAVSNANRREILLGRATVEARIRQEVPTGNFHWAPEDKDLGHRLQVLVGNQCIINTRFKRTHLEDNSGAAAVMQIEGALKAHRGMNPPPPQGT